MLFEKNTGREGRQFRSRVLRPLGELAFCSLVGIVTVGTLIGFGKSSNDLERCMDVLEGMNPIEVVDDYCYLELLLGYDFDISPQLTPDGTTIGYTSPTTEQIKELRLSAENQKARVPEALAIGAGAGFAAGVYALYLAPSKRKM